MWLCRAAGTWGSRASRGTFRVALELTLFTFWPPGPDDVLKVNSPIVSRGIVCACSAASHVRAASRPSSAPWPGEPEDDEDDEEDEEDEEYEQQQATRRGKRVVAGEQRTGRRMRRGWSSSMSVRMLRAAMPDYLLTGTNCYSPVASPLQAGPAAKKQPSRAEA